ncbi:MAG: capsular polysaccharide export protein, partial [Campylobacterota bacterium]|nr:capsular polysaccharide export protein [Campylobacterota bacterium]
MQTKSRLFFFGFYMLKQRFMPPFFNSSRTNILLFCNSLKEAIKKNINRNDIIYVWGRKNYKEICEYAQKNNIKISVVEDGFIRSVSLGSDLTQPFSLVVDTQGIYFDPSTPSDLEKIL